MTIDHIILFFIFCVRVIYNIPWFKQTHKRAARHKCRAYAKAKSTNAPGDLEVYRKLRRSLDRSLRKCKSEHLKAIGDYLMTSNSKPFWKFIKSLRQLHMCIIT